MSIIYKITNLVNNKIYVGFTGFSIEERFYLHKKDARKKTPTTSLLHKAMKKYGEHNFIIESIYESDDYDHTLRVMEEYYINLLGSRAPYGYNIQRGGLGNKNPKSSKPVDIYDENLKLISTFPSIRSASRFLNSKSSTVYNACVNAENNKASQVKGRWVCLHGSKPIKRDYSYLSERNKINAKLKSGIKRPDHSKFMKEYSSDKTIFNFKHKSGIKFSGTRQELIKAFPNDGIKSSDLGVMIRGRYKHHKGWYL